MRNYCLDGIMGLCVGDALGVPVEFCERKYLNKNPVVNMRSYGSHNQPKGTWSDDTSMTLCLTESLLNGLDYYDIANKFYLWESTGYMTPYGVVFDIGNSTINAILNFKHGKKPLLCGGNSEHDNGNGSLMRILPLVFYLKDCYQNRFNIIKDVSSITHSHPRSVIACCIYVETGIQLIKENTLESAFEAAKHSVYFYFDKYQEYKSEIELYKNVLSDSLEYQKKPRQDILSSGYVVDTLNACMWCLFNFKGYKESILAAVNLGDDTDTTAAVTGGLAGLLYGYSSIPEEWLSVIAQRKRIENLCDSFHYKLNK